MLFLHQSKSGESVAIALHTSCYYHNHLQYYYPLVKIELSIGVDTED